MKINWGTGLIIFLGLFFVWVIGFVLFALRQNVDLVSDDYYQKGAKYSDQISINQRSGTYQDSIQITQTENQVQVALSKNLSVTADSVQLYFFRSSDKKKDVRLNLKNSGSPLLVEKSLLSHGRYQMFISWNNKEEKFMVKKLLDIP